MEIGQGITMVSERAVNPHKFPWFLFGSSEPKNWIELRFFWDFFQALQPHL